MYIWDYRAGSTVRNTGCSSQGPAFSSQHPQQRAHNTCNSSFRGSNPLSWLPLVPAQDTQTHNRNTKLTFKKKEVELYSMLCACTHAHARTTCMSCVCMWVLCVHQEKTQNTETSLMLAATPVRQVKRCTQPWHLMATAIAFHHSVLLPLRSPLCTPHPRCCCKYYISIEGFYSIFDHSIPR